MTIKNIKHLTKLKIIPVELRLILKSFEMNGLRSKLAITVQGLVKKYDRAFSIHFLRLNLWVRVRDWAYLLVIKS